MKNCLSSLASLTPEFSTTYGSTQTVRLALHMMDFHGPGSSTQCQASAGVHGTAQLDSSPARKMCCLERKVMLHNSGNRWMDESETLPPGMLGANCKVWWRRDICEGFAEGPLVQVKGLLTAAGCKDVATLWYQLFCSIITCPQSEVCEWLNNYGLE